MTNFIEITLSNQKEVSFYAYPLAQPFNCQHCDLKPDLIDRDLCDILLDPNDYEALYPGKKNFLGFGSSNPNSTYRFPVWLRPELNQHLLIAGAIGSGKTSLTYRLIAGALNTFGTVVIGEVNSGKGGYAPGSAFTELAEYLEKRLSIRRYRWPRGNCWFNPLPYLKNRDDRTALLKSVVKQIPVEGDMRFFVESAADIASLVIEFMQLAYQKKPELLTLRFLVLLLRNPEKLMKSLADLTVLLDNSDLTEVGVQTLDQLKSIQKQLTLSNFFYLDKPEYMGTRRAIFELTNLLDDEELLYYSEPNDRGLDEQPLKELTIDNLLYDRSLMVVSQPDRPSSQIVGPLLWDALYGRVQDLGPGLPQNESGRKREKVAVFLDETHRLSVGKLGDCGDRLRQYEIGLIEITPAIVDRQRWELNKNVWQTILSLSPPVDEVIDLMYEQLENQPEDSSLYPTVSWGEKGLNIGVGIKPNAQQSGRDHPGVSKRSLRYTGKNTGLLKSNLINGGGLFWLDFQHPLLAQLDPSLDCSLLKDALKTDGSSVAKRAIDYALGLATDFPV
jgi:hypothetical protein